MELYKLTGGELHRLMKEKKVSAVEVTEDTFARIAKVENGIGAFITATPEEAMKTAQAVDKKIAAGEELHPLAGIPIGIKDNICTKDIKTTCASKMLENFVPPYDATVITKLKAVDYVMTGKMNMDEFAMGSSCENSAFHITHNPHGLDKVPGGSSGGSAAAVAAGEAVMSLGSDTGGSIREPAAYCGIIGLKPTYGAVSRYGLVAFASSLDQIGPMGRSVEDVANLFYTISGQDPYDATSMPTHYPKTAEGLGYDLAGLRIGVPKEFYKHVDVAVGAAIWQVIRTLEARGAKVVNISLPSTEYGLSAYYIISSAEASSNLSRFDGVKYGFRAENYTDLNDMYEKTRSEGFGDEVKRRIMLGTFVLSSGYYDAYYKKAKLFQQKVRAEYDEAFKQCDVIVTPTAPTAAFKIGENVHDPLKMYASDICTITVNIAGLPALSLPIGMDHEMPVGMQLIGPHFSEEKLLGIAKEFEILRGGLCKVATVV